MPDRLDIEPKPMEVIPSPPLKGKLEETTPPSLPKGSGMNAKDWFRVAKGAFEQWSLSKIGMGVKETNPMVYVIISLILAIAAKILGVY